jgi:co-chaperonin GroES (HSP10)
MIMNYTPLSDKVIIERIEGEKATSTGIILKRADEVDRAKILAIGPDVDEVQVGDVVLLNWNAAIKVEGEMYSTKVENIVFIYGE